PPRSTLFPYTTLFRSHVRATDAHLEPLVHLEPDDREVDGGRAERQLEPVVRLLECGREREGSIGVSDRAGVVHQWTGDWHARWGRVELAPQRQVIARRCTSRSEIKLERLVASRLSKCDAV